MCCRICAQAATEDPVRRVSHTSGDEGEQQPTWLRAESGSDWLVTMHHLTKQRSCSLISGKSAAKACGGRTITNSPSERPSSDD
jgi:hypothetical protein